MRRTSSSPLRPACALAAALVVAVLAGACGDGVRISLQLQTAQGGDPAPDASALRSLTITLDNGEVQDRQSFALDRTQQVVVPELAVDRTKPFTIDVWACEIDQCLESDVKLRGCTPVPLDVSSTTEDPVVVTIQMFDASDDALRVCPAIAP